MQNDNGERLVEWCAFNNMIIGGTLFPHRNIHKLTWTSPNERYQNQIDHLSGMINSMWHRSLLDVRVRPGADASSDHHLVTAKVRLKLRADGAHKQNTPRYDISRLQDARTKTVFVLPLRNRFQALSNIDEQDNEGDTVNQQWEQVRNIFDEASKTCLGMQRTRKKERLDYTRHVAGYRGEAPSEGEDK